MLINGNVKVDGNITVDGLSGSNVASNERPRRYVIKTDSTQTIGTTEEAITQLNGLTFPSAVDGVKTYRVRFFVGLIDITNSGRTLITVTLYAGDVGDGTGGSDVAAQTWAVDLEDNHRMVNLSGQTTIVPPSGSGRFGLTAIITSGSGGTGVLGTSGGASSLIEVEEV